MMSEFRFGTMYTRAQVQEALGLMPSRGGNWDTGHHFHDGEWFLFPNIGVAGRTGHDYGNHWVDEGLHWYARNHSRLQQPSMQSLVAPGRRVHLFTRAGDRDPFTYRGLVTPLKVADTSPVEIIWRLPGQMDPADRPLPEEVPAATYPEGAVRTIKVNAHERNPAARRACIDHWQARCDGCGLNMAERYGPIAEGFIHVHHLQPLAIAGGPRAVDPIEDLRPVCPNCHSVIHLSDPPLTIEQLRTTLRPPR
jgi:5-methylcytosine-specific restriction protein A